MDFVEVSSYYQYLQENANSSLKKKSFIPVYRLDPALLCKDESKFAFSQRGSWASLLCKTKDGCAVSFATPNLRGVRLLELRSKRLWRRKRSEYFSLFFVKPRRVLKKSLVLELSSEPKKLMSEFVYSTAFNSVCKDSIYTTKFGAVSNYVMLEMLLLLIRRIRLRRHLVQRASQQYSLAVLKDIKLKRSDRIFQNKFIEVHNLASSLPFSFINSNKGSDYVPKLEISDTCFYSILNQARGVQLILFFILHNIYSTRITNIESKSDVLYRTVCTRVYKYQYPRGTVINLAKFFLS